jgi:hypothetical protein
MRPFDDLSAKAVALLFATVSAFVAAGCAFVSSIFVGAKFFHDKIGYGVPLALGPPLSIVTGSVAFFFVFRKMRGLAR